MIGPRPDQIKGVPRPGSAAFPPPIRGSPSGPPGQVRPTSRRRPARSLARHSPCPCPPFPIPYAPSSGSPHPANATSGGREPARCRHPRIGPSGPGSRAETATIPGTRASPGCMLSSSSPWRRRVSAQENPTSPGDPPLDAAGLATRRPTRTATPPTVRCRGRRHARRGRRTAPGHQSIGRRRRRPPRRPPGSTAAAPSSTTAATTSAESAADKQLRELLQERLRLLDEYDKAIDIV